MQEVLYIAARSIQILLIVVQVAFVLRMVLSWFIMNDQNRFLIFLYAMTEPFALPFRVICHMFGYPDDFPIDIPFSIAFLAISILNTVLPTLPT